MPSVHPTRHHQNTATAIFVATILLTAIFLAMAPAGQAGFHGNMGSFVSSTSDQDFLSVLEGSPGGEKFCFGYIEDSSDPGDAASYAWMFHIATSGTCDTSESPTSQRTWLITDFGGNTQQKWITSADTQYTGTDFDGIEELTTAKEWMCYSESDGIEGYSIGDIIYVKEGFSEAGTQNLEVDDLRLTVVSSSTLTPFSESVGIVESSDTDFKRGGESSGSPPSGDPSRLPVDRSLTCGGFDVKMLNLGTINTINSQDAYYITHSDLLTDATVYPGMLRITSNSDVSGHGQKVLTANNDNKHTLNVVGLADLNLVVVDDEGTGDIFDKKLAIQQADHPAGDNADDLIQMHDIFIKRGTGDSSSSPGTLVTAAPSSSQIGVASEIDDSTPLKDQIYYMDKSPTGVFDEDDPVYIKHPDNGDSGGVQEGDIRLDVPGQSSGTSVRTSDSDFLEHQGSNGEFDFTLKLFSERDDTRMPLKSVSNGKFISATDIATWDPTTDPVFITSASKMEVGMEARQVWNPATEQPVNIDVDCDGNNPVGEAGGDDWCGDEDSLKTGGKLKTTGQKSTWQDDGEDDGDRLYWSDDNFLTIGDYRMGHGAAFTQNHVSTTGQVAAGDADVDPGALFQSSGVTLFASTDSTFEHPTSGDIQLFPSFGTRWTHSTSGAVPNPQEITSYGIVRADLDDGGSLLDDVYYLDFSSTPCTDLSPGRALRMLPFDGKNAGSFVVSGDTEELQSTQQCEDATPENHFGYIDNAPTGLGSTDFVYLNLPDGIGGSTGITLSQWDSRVTPASHGSENFAAGTQVMVADSDHQSFSGDALEGSGDAKIFWWDANHNDVVDQDDALWLRIRTGLTTDTPTFLDIRLNGSPASGGGGSGGGSGGGDPSDPVTRPTASFTVDVEGREITLDASESAAISGRSITSFAWDFGDDNEATGSTATHTYDEEGQYTVRLTVTDSQDETATTTRTVQTEGYVPPGDDDDDNGNGISDDDGMSDDDDEGDGEEEATPGIAIVAVLAVLGVALFALRKRR